MHHAWALGRATDKQGIVQIIKHQDANTWPMRTDWVKEACLAWRKQSFGRQITALQHLQEGYKENRAWFPRSCMVGHRGNTHKLKQEMLRLHIQKHLFTIKTARYWKRLYWKAVRSPSFEVFRTWVDKDLSNLVPTSNQPHVEQEVGLEISQHSFQPLSSYNLQSLTLLLKNTKIFQRRKKLIAGCIAVLFSKRALFTTKTAVTVAKQTQKKCMSINLGERRLKDSVLNNRINIETEVLLQQYTAQWKQIKKALIDWPSQITLDFLLIINPSQKPEYY